MRTTTHDTLFRTPRLLVATLMAAAAFCLAASSVRAQEATKAERPVTAVVEAPSTNLPFLWRVEMEGRPKPSYMFGTMHTSDERVLRSLKRIDWVIKGSDALYTELEMDLESIMAILPLVFMPDNQTLYDVLPAATMKKLRTFFREKGLDIEPLKRMQPGLLAAALAYFDMKEVDPFGALDMKLYARAAELGLEVGGIETAEEQIGVFKSMTMEEQAKYLDAALDERIENPGKTARMLDEMTDFYASGDEEGLMEFFMAMNEDELSHGDDALREANTRFMRMLLEDRNHHMAERFAKMLREHPEKTYILGVGLGHYPGPEGILELMKLDGFTVERVPEEDYILNAGENWDAIEPEEAKPESFPKGSLADRLMKKK
jgi:uncharacterized protein YbaP (TraB family)